MQRYYAFLVGCSKLVVKILYVSSNWDDLIKNLGLEKYSPDCFLDDCPHHWETKQSGVGIPDLPEGYEVHIFYPEKEHWYALYGEDHFRCIKDEDLIYIISSRLTTDNITDLMEIMENSKTTM